MRKKKKKQRKGVKTENKRPQIKKWCKVARGVKKKDCVRNEAARMWWEPALCNTSAMEVTSYSEPSNTTSRYNDRNGIHRVIYYFVS